MSSDTISRLGLATLAILVFKVYFSSAACPDEFKCPKYSVHTFDIEPSCNVTIIANRHTRRCVNLFRPTGGCTDLLMLCGGTNFMLPNKDPHLCRKGDVMFVKPDNHKVWFRGRNIMAPSRYAMCTVYCHSGTYLS